MTNSEIQKAIKDAVDHPAVLTEEQYQAELADERKRRAELEAHLNELVAENQRARELDK